MVGREVARGFLVPMSLVLLMAACAPAAAPTPTPTKAPAAVASTPTPAPPKPTAAPPTPTPKPATVRFGSPGAISDAGIYIGIEKGYFKEQGVDVQVLPFQSGPLMIAPLAAGELEVAGGTISTGLLNAIERGVALKIVAGKGSNVKGFDFSRFTVRK
ncbi:MAG TPA: ABC transporter substrate-binding protein, partial [Dehalococcoidia bacterium]|nr:ABC transporter substrate-binding protein [Dehalococcoidia bacterium]